MNFIKKWLGIYHIDHRLEEMQIEINELKAYQMTDRDNIVRLSDMYLLTQKSQIQEINLAIDGILKTLGRRATSRKKPGPKSRKKKLPSSQERE